MVSLGISLLAVPPGADKQSSPGSAIKTAIIDEAPPLLHPDRGFDCALEGDLETKLGLIRSFLASVAPSR
jgi:hypothetical protein